MSRVVMTLAVTFALLMVYTISAIHGSSSQQPRIRPEHRDTSQAFVGTKASEFVGLNWLNSKPLTLSSLQGKTVLLHFWHGDCCCCKNDIDGLRYLQTTYGPRGLVVIAIHDSSRTSDEINTLIAKWGVEFPVALDGDWNTTKNYQFINTSNYTPGAFLIDGNGIITRVRHPYYLELPARLGGKATDGDFDDLELAINNALNSNKVVQNANLPPVSVSIP